MTRLSARSASAAFILLFVHAVAGTIPSSAAGSPSDSSPSDSSAADSLAGKRPNILFLLTDDQGYGDFSAHGNPVLKTPHLDRLHAEGVRFTDFLVSPTCSPTRSALMSGRHEFKNGVTHTILERERLALGTTTLPQLLRSAGYTTGIFGKWHLGDEAEYRPDRRGFDEVFIHGAGGIGQTYPGSCGDAPGNRYFDPAILHNGKFVKTEGYCTDVFYQQATSWIDAQRQAGKPFFAYVPTNAPHSPYIARPEDKAIYEGQGLTPEQENFFGMLHNIDANVGRLLAKLEEWGIANETLVIFMNDNGGTAGVKVFNAEMRGSKGSPWVGGTRAASLWRWPGTLRPADCEALVAHIDFLPTIADVAGVKLDDAIRQQVEGRSLVPLLRDATAGWDDRYLCTHVGRWTKLADPNESKFRAAAVRNKRWAMVSERGGATPDWQLFDLSTDFAQQHNVLDAHPEVAKELSAAFDRWWAECLPLMVNETAVGPKINPFQAMYYEQFGGSPTAEDLRKMDPSNPLGLGVPPQRPARRGPAAKATQPKPEATPPKDASATGAAPRYDPEKLPRGQEYFELRTGLGNSRYQFERDRRGRVAFLGGSITASPGWRDQVMAYFRERFPQTEFDFVSAGVSSLGSVPHAFRLQSDLLSQGPVDLLFVEAAVNDTTNTKMPLHMLRGMEGVVRQLRTLNPLIDIVQLHFVMPEHIADYGRGSVPESIAQHEQVAAAYGNVSLNLALEVSERIAAGEFTWAEDFRDLHPAPFGHRLYANSITRMLQAAFAGNLAETPRPHPQVDPPLDPHSYARGRFGAIASARLIRGFTLDPSWHPADGKGTRAGFVNVPALVGAEPGAEFEFSFEGTGAGLFITSGPDAGQIEFSIDGGDYRTTDTFTQWSPGLHLPWAVILDDELKAGPHTVKVRIGTDHDPRGTGTAVRVFHLLLN